MELVRKNSLYEIFSAVIEDIAKGFYTSRSATYNGHFKKCSDFYEEVSLDPLLVSCNATVPVLYMF